MTVAATPTRVALSAIDVGENVRELDETHLDALARSIALRGLISPLTVRPGEPGRFALVAGRHRHAACVKLDLEEVEVVVRDVERTSADTAAENIVRNQLSPLGEACAVGAMLDEGLTLDGAAEALGWTRALVRERAKILELPEIAQRLLDTGELPVSAVDPLLRISAVSPELCEAAVAPVAEGEISGGQLASDPGWAMAWALRNGAKAFAAYLGTVSANDIEDLRLGKQATAAYVECEELRRPIDRYAYGPPTIRFAEVEVDQARAAGVLIEFERGTPIICDRSLYRELVKQAIARTVEELRERKAERDTERAQARRAGSGERTPEQELEAEHRSAMRELTARAHNTNLDLGAGLLQELAVVDPDSLDVARFFAYGLLGADSDGFYSSDDLLCRRLAANGIRLVLDEFRTTETPTLKSGQPGKAKVTYGEVDDAVAWLWKFVDGAKSAGELYGRTMVVFAAQHYAKQLVLAASKRRHSALPSSHDDRARKAFERVCRSALPDTHKQLERAIAREVRDHSKRQREPHQAQRPPETAQDGD